MCVCVCVCLYAMIMTPIACTHMYVLQRLHDAEQKLAEKQATLAEARAKLQEVKEKLDSLQKQYEEKLATKEELKRKAELTELRLDRAAKLVYGLAGERVRWEESVKVCTYIPMCTSGHLTSSYMYMYTCRNMKRRWVTW